MKEFDIGVQNTTGKILRKGDIRLEFDMEGCNLYYVMDGGKIPFQNSPTTLPITGATVVQPGELYSVRIGVEDKGEGWFELTFSADGDILKTVKTKVSDI